VGYALQASHAAMGRGRVGVRAGGESICALVKAVVKAIEKAVVKL
jgi:hypothetical protein